jgi:phospholipid/cholesterol/gamma-HCH transport system ATP-binding protein
MIRAENITKSFGGREVLKNISATFEPGKTNLIIGKSGSGKTVFLKCIVGLLEIDEGEI